MENNKLYQEKFLQECQEVFNSSKIASKADALEAIYKDNFVKKILLEVNKPHIAIQVVKEFLREFSREEFDWFYTDLAKKVFQKEQIQDNQLLLIFSKKLRDKCLEIEELIKYPIFLEKIISKKKKSSSPFFEIHGLIDLQECVEEEFLKQNLFLWDFAFLKVLKKTGTHGKTFAKKIAEKLQDNTINYFQIKKSSMLLDTWFADTQEGEYFFHSPVFLILAEAVFLDSIQKLYDRKKKMFQRLQREFGIVPSNLRSQKISLSI